MHSVFPRIKPRYNFNFIVVSFKLCLLLFAFFSLVKGESFKKILLYFLADVFERKLLVLLSKLLKFLLISKVIYFLLIDKLLFSFLLYV